MKNFLILFAILLGLLLGISQMHFLKRTPYGHFYGSFKYESSRYLPPILVGYLANNSVKYSLYKLPYYVTDFLMYNNDFSIVYKTKPKFTVVVFKNDNQKDLGHLYQKLNLLQKSYSKNFNLIVRDSLIVPDYIQSFERDAYKDFELYCGNFCIIDPSKNVMFLFKSFSFNDLEALEGVFQHLSYMYK